MSVTVTPSDPTVGQTLKFRVKYEGPPPPPDDLHIEVETEAGYTPITGYERIPDDRDPVEGFEIPVPPTPDWDTAGRHHFRVRWTRGGKLIATENVYVTTQPRPEPPPRDKEWDWYVFWGKVVGGGAGSIISGVLLNWWTGVGLLVCAITGGLGGSAGGALGYLFVHIFDAPRIRWTFRTAFLFVLFFTLAFSMVLGLLAVDLEREWAEQEVWNRVTLGVSAVSAFLAATLAGVLNNLRDEV